jgi:hypothetical protein
MIQSFKHRGLKALYDGRTARKVAPAHVEKLRDILAVLDRSRARAHGFLGDFGAFAAINRGFRDIDSSEDFGAASPVLSGR